MQVMMGAYRWVESDALLMPRGESEEETLVGSFTKLLVSTFHFLTSCSNTKCIMIVGTKSLSGRLAAVGCEGEVRATVLAQVSQEDDFSEGKGVTAAAGAPGQPGRLGLSCAQQAPKPAHQPAGTD